MGRGKKFLTDALPLAASGLIMRAVTVSFNAYVAKKLGAEAMGLYGLVTSVGTFAVVLASSGINLAAVRLCAAATAAAQTGGGSDTRRIMRKCVLYALIFGSASCALLLILSGTLGRSLLSDCRTVPALRALAISLPAISVSSAIAGYFTGTRKIGRSVISLTFDQLLRILSVTSALILFEGRSLAALCAALVSGNALADWLTLIISAALCRMAQRRENRRNASRSLSSPGGAVRGHKKTSVDASLRGVASIALPVAIGAYLRTGLTSLEHIAIPWGLRRSGFSPEKALASYGAVSQMALPVVLFPYAVIGAFTSLLVPEMTALSERNDKAGVRDTARRVIRLTVFFGIAVAGVFSSFGKIIGSSVYNDPEAGEIIRLLAPCMPVMFLDTAVDSMLKGLGEQVFCAKVNTLDAVICLATVLIAVPRFGIAGYIAVIYASEAVNAALSIGRLTQIAEVSLSPGWIVSLLAAPFASLAAGTLFWNTLSAALPVPSSLGIVLFCAAYLLCGGAILAAKRKRTGR